MAVQDADSPAPDTLLGYLDTNRSGMCTRGCLERETCDTQVCFRNFDDDVYASPAVTRTSVGADIWQYVWTVNSTEALARSGGEGRVELYLRVRDGFTQHIGFHHVAFVTQATTRHRRDIDAAAPRSATMSITIDADGQLSGDMVFPDAWVSNAGNGGNGAVVQVRGGTSTRASDRDLDEDEDESTNSGDTDIDDVSDNQQMVIIVALVCGVGCFCVLGAALCLAFAALRHKGTVRFADENKSRCTAV